MRRLSLSLNYRPSLRHPLHDRLIANDQSVTRVDLLGWGPTGDPRALLWVDASHDGAKHILAAEGTKTQFQQIEDGTYAILYSESFSLPDPVLEITRNSEAVFLPPVSFRADGAVHVRAVGTGTALSALVEALDPIADTTIRSVEPYRHTGVSAPTTERQREALSVAADLGYYQRPREAGVKAVAAELDCAESTAGELIRRGERAVIESFLDGYQS